MADTTILRDISSKYQGWIVFVLGVMVLLVLAFGIIGLYSFGNETICACKGYVCKCVADKIEIVALVRYISWLIWTIVIYLGLIGVVCKLLIVEKVLGKTVIEAQQKCN